MKNAKIKVASFKNLEQSIENMEFHKKMFFMSYECVSLQMQELRNQVKGTIFSGDEQKKGHSNKP